MNLMNPKSVYFLYQPLEEKPINRNCQEPSEDADEKNEANLANSAETINKGFINLYLYSNFWWESINSKLSVHFVKNDRRD
jgi:hypothetical protein